MCVAGCSDSWLLLGVDCYLFISYNNAATHVLDRHHHVQDKPFIFITTNCSSFETLASIEKKDAEVFCQFNERQKFSSQKILRVSVEYDKTWKNHKRKNLSGLSESTKKSVSFQKDALANFCCKRSAIVVFVNVKYYSHAVPCYHLMTSHTISAVDLQMGWLITVHWGLSLIKDREFLINQPFVRIWIDAVAIITMKKSCDRVTDAIAKCERWLYQIKNEVSRSYQFVCTKTSWWGGNSRSQTILFWDTYTCLSCAVCSKIALKTSLSSRDMIPQIKVNHQSD